jgi:hypothetical protein
MYQILLIICGVFGSIAAFGLQRYGLTAVASACLVGLMGVIVGFFSGDTIIPAVIFAGAFAGMTALRIGSFPLMFAAGALTGLFCILSPHIFSGYGGRLGATAFIATALVIWVAEMF